MVKLDLGRRPCGAGGVTSLQAKSVDIARPDSLNYENIVLEPGLCYRVRTWFSQHIGNS